MDEAPLNKKNITGEIIGYDLDEMLDDELPPELAADAAPDAAGTPAPEDNGTNAIIDLVEIGLDMSEDILREMGYPADGMPNRKIWERHGKNALNRALNVYFPPGSTAGGMIDSPLVSLVIGLGALALCMYPVVSHTLKQKEIEKAKAEEPKLPPQEETPEPASTTPISNKPLSIPEQLAELEDVIV